MFTVNGKEYALKYSLARVEMIEKACGASLVELMARGGMLPIAVLKACIAFGMLGEDGVFIAVKAGYEHAERLIETNGYVPVTQAVLEALQRDCPFFFQGV